MPARLHSCLRSFFSIPAGAGRLAGPDALLPRKLFLDSGRSGIVCCPGNTPASEAFSRFRQGRNSLLPWERSCLRSFFSIPAGLKKLVVPGNTPASEAFSRFRQGQEGLPARLRSCLRSFFSIPAGAGRLCRPEALLPRKLNSRYGRAGEACCPRNAPASEASSRFRQERVKHLGCRLSF